MSVGTKIALLVIGSLGLGDPALARPIDQAAQSGPVGADRPFPCVRQSVEAGVAIVRATTSDRCGVMVAVARAPGSWRDAFGMAAYCHAQDTACSFELSDDRSWPAEDRSAEGEGTLDK